MYIYNKLKRTYRSIERRSKRNNIKHHSIYEQFDFHLSLFIYTVSLSWCISTHTQNNYSTLCETYLLICTESEKWEGPHAVIRWD